MKKGRTAIKRAIAGVLTLMLVVSMLPTHIPARAAEEVETGGSLTITGDTTVIIGSSGIQLSAATNDNAPEVSGPEATSTEEVKIPVDSDVYANVSENDKYTDDDYKDKSDTTWKWSSDNADAVTLKNGETSTVTVTAEKEASDVKITATKNETETYWVVTEKKTEEVTTEGGSGDEGSTEEGSTDEGTTETKYYLILQEMEQTTTYTGTYTVSTVYDTLDSITLDKTELTLDLVNTTTGTLTATLKGANGGTVDPDTKISWTSSDADVATVDNGTVTAKGIGTADITASVGDISATCTVTVEEVTTENTGAARTLTYGDSETLSVTDKGGEVTWSSSDTSVATVDSTGGVTAVGVGTTTVTATETGTGYTTTTTFKVTVEPIELTVEVKENTVITKESDGTTDVTTDNQNDIRAALSLSGDVLGDDDVSIDVTNYGTYSGSGVGDRTITVTVGLTGEDADNYTLSSEKVILDAKITAATPTDKTLDLTIDGKDTLTLSDKGKKESITFEVATKKDADGSLWFTGDETLTAEGYTLYTEYENERDNTKFDGSMTEGEKQKITLYVKPDNKEKVYGPITVIYNYDETAPTVTSVVIGDTDDAINFSNTSLTYTITVSDGLNGSGADSDEIYYYISTSEEDSDPDWVQLGDEDLTGENGTYYFTVEVPATGYLHVKASDYVGYVSETCVSKPLVIEANAPAIDSFEDADEGTDHTAATPATNHKFEFKATDAGDDYSGIMKVVFTLTNTEDENDTYTYTYEWENAPTSLDDLDGYKTVTVDFSLTDKYFEKLSNPTGTYELTAVVTDYCGNSTETASVITVVLDNDAPTATLTMTKGTEYGDVDGDGTYYYNADNAGFTVTIDDYTIDNNDIDEGVNYSIDVGDENLAKGTVYGKDDNCIEVGSDVLKGLGDGTITVTVTVTDAAENKTETLTCADGIEANVSDMTFSFVLDITAPTLDSVELTEGNYVSDDKAVYYNGDNDDNDDNSGFKAVYTITEENFYADGVTLGNASPTGTGTLGDDAALSVSGNTVTVSVASAEDVENSIYQPTVTVTDKAGNAMTTVNSGFEITYGDATVTGGTVTLDTALVLDTVAPVLESVSSTASDNYYDDESRVYYNSAFEIEWQVTEANYAKTATWTVYHTGDGSDATTNDGTVNGSSITFTAEVTRQSNVESAAYRPSLEVVDKAGNAMVLSSGSYNGNDYDTVSVSDGIATADNEYVLDTAAPEFTLKFNRTPSDTELYSDSYVYFNNTFNATFTVTDDNLDSDQMRFAPLSPCRRRSTG